MDIQRLNQLAGQFAREMRTSEDLQSHLADHERRRERARAMLTQERIPTLSENDLRELFFDSDAFGYWRNKEWEFQERLKKVGTPGLRSALMEVITRAERGLKPDDLKHIWGMRGLGRLLTTELLSYRFPDRYWTYNESVTLKALRVLDEDVKASMPRGQGSDPYIYCALAPPIGQVRDALMNAGLADVNNLHADLFLYWLTRRPEAESPRRADADKHACSIWLFQANPRYYDLAEELKHRRVGDVVSWAATTSFRKMHAGDKVVLWQSGPGGGIFALGDLVGDPYQREQPMNEDDSEEAPYKRSKWWVDVRYTCILEQPITREVVKAHPILRNLEVLRWTNATNYRITEEEWAAIQALLNGETEPSSDVLASLDRNSEDAARRVFERIVPDPEIRRTCLEFLADSIVHAHGCGKSAWEITLYSNGARLNVAQIEVLVYMNDTSKVILDAESIRESVREILGDRLEVGADLYRSVSGPKGIVLFTPDEASDVLPLVREPHLRLIENAARTKQTSSFKESYSPGIVEYLRSYLNREVPHPAYYQVAAPTPTIDVPVAVASFLASKGLKFLPWQVATFYTALQVKGFVILSGISGTGKTKLAQHFAEMLPGLAEYAQPAIPESECTGNLLFISVRPDWRDSKGMLGYYNPLTQTYEGTPFLRFLQQAIQSYKARDGLAWFVILDEMNLARVEYYFADMLSVLESGRDEKGWTREALRLDYPQDADTELPRELRIPPNLYVIGTVNVDETTHAFSPKVLDRAFALELADVSFANYPPRPSGEASALSDGTRQAILASFTRGGTFGRVDKREIAGYVERHPEVRDRLDRLNALLRPHDLHFGYRVFDEIVTFLCAADENRMFEMPDAGDPFDAAVLMKVLPKFHGSTGKLERPLRSVLAWCVAPDEPDHQSIESALSQAEDGSGVADKLDSLTYECPKTARRAIRMLQALYTDGFAAFS